MWRRITAKWPPAVSADSSAATAELVTLGFGINMALGGGDMGGCVERERDAPEGGTRGTRVNEERNVMMRTERENGGETESAHQAETERERERERDGGNEGMME